MMLASSNALKSSAMYIGYLILKEIQKRDTEKVSIYDVSKALKKAGREDLIGFGPKCLLRPGGKAPVRSGEKPVRPKKKTIRNTHRKKNS